MNHDKPWKPLPIIVAAALVMWPFTAMATAPTTQADWSWLPGMVTHAVTGATTDVVHGTKHAATATVHGTEWFVHVITFGKF